MGIFRYKLQKKPIVIPRRVITILMGESNFIDLIGLYCFYSYLANKTKQKKIDIDISTIIGKTKLKRMEVNILTGKLNKLAVINTYSPITKTNQKNQLDVLSIALPYNIQPVKNDTVGASTHVRGDVPARVYPSTHSVSPRTDKKNKKRFKGKEKEKLKKEKENWGFAGVQGRLWLEKDDKVEIRQRNKNFLGYASHLEETVRSLPTITGRPRKLIVTDKIRMEWADNFRKLHDGDGDRLTGKGAVDLKRIERVLVWYRDNIGGEFVPVAYSGYTFCQKFDRIEAAIKRDQSPTAEIKPINTRDYLEEKLSDGTKIMDSEIRILNEIIQKALGLIEGGSESKLTKNAVTLYQYISKNRNGKAIDHNEFATPSYLLEDYVYYLKNTSWIKDITESAFTPEGIFTRYRKDRKKTYYVDPITGK